MKTLKLINVYVQEVTRRLPEKMREDIAMELHSTIEDMLPENSTEEDVKQILEKLGNPATLAAEYKDQPMHLIGPKFYDTYVTILKMVLGIASIVVLVLFFIDKIGSIQGNEISLLINGSILLGEAVWVLLGTVIQVFFWVTIVFIILDRTISPSTHEPLTLSGEIWKPNDLENITYIPPQKAITMSEVLIGLSWTIIWALLYFNATQLIAVYESQADPLGLQFKLPIFNQEILISYWPFVVLLIILEILMTIYKVKVRQWTNKLAISNTITNLAGIALFILIASNPNLLNPEFSTYLSTILETSSENMETSIHWTKWVIIISVIATSLIDIYSGFRKAKAK